MMKRRLSHNPSKLELLMVGANGAFMPKENASSAEAAVMLKRCLNFAGFMN